MTPEAYVKAVQHLAQRREYGPLIDFVERVGPTVEDHLTAEQVRILRVHLKHADMVLAEARSRVNTA
jgi:hypothetical protein